MLDQEFWYSLLIILEKFIIIYIPILREYFEDTLLLFISLNSFSDVSFGELENFVIESDYDTRKIQIYYPNNKIIDSDTLFIFMNDGEELLMLLKAGITWSGA